MKKLSVLLHDVTVINFSMILKLMKRYRKASLSVGLMGIGIASYLYLGQEAIWQKQVFFKVKNNISSHTQKDLLAEVLAPAGNSINYLKKPEVQALTHTYDFTQELAQQLISSADFEKFDFSHPVSKDNSTHQEIQKCADEDCKRRNLRQIIPHLFSVEAEMGTNRIALTVTTRSKLTTMNFIKSFHAALDKIRHEQALAVIDLQIKQTMELIEKSNADIEAKGGMDKVANSDFLAALISQQKDKVTSIGERLNREKDQLHFQQIRLKESHTTSNSDVDSQDKTDFQTLAKLRKKKEDLSSNIASISSILPQARTETDDQVLRQLQLELKKIEGEISRIGIIKRNIAFDSTFINQQLDNQSSFEFDFKVSMAKVKSLQAEYDNSKDELDKLFSRRAMMESELVALKPDLEYLKMLEAKLISTRIKRAAINSEVEFDPYGPEILSYKRNSLIQILIFSMMAAIFMLMLLLTTVYLMDDRIHDEEELEKLIFELPVIGKTPNFD